MNCNGCAARRRALEEFEDVTAAEKDFMFAWDAFMRGRALFADALLPDAVALFAIDQRAALRAAPALRHCFTLHMVNLWDYGLLSGEQIDRALRLISSGARARGPLLPRCRFAGPNARCCGVSSFLPKGMSISL